MSTKYKETFSTIPKDMYTYNPPEKRVFMKESSYIQYEKDVEVYKIKRQEFKNNKEALKTLNWPDINVYMTSEEIRRHTEALQKYNRDYREMVESKIEFVLKVGLQPLEDIVLSKKDLRENIRKGLADKKSRLWEIVTGSYSEIVDVIGEEYIGHKKVKITAVIHELDPVQYIQDAYGALAADGWQEGDIILGDKYEVTLDLVSVKIISSNLPITL